MKITTNEAKPEFRPVSITITLESQQEVDNFRNVLGNEERRRRMAQKYADRFGALNPDVCDLFRIADMQRALITALKAATRS